MDACNIQLQNKSFVICIKSFLTYTCKKAMYVQLWAKQWSEWTGAEGTLQTHSFDKISFQTSFLQLWMEETDLSLSKSQQLSCTLQLQFSCDQASYMDQVVICKHAKEQYV